MKYAAAVLLVVLAALSGRLINFSKLADGFKGDEATYVLMTFSIADDFDMKYQSRDLVRFYNIYRDDAHPNGLGPNGIFIKKGSRVTGWKRGALIREEIPTTESIQYGKAFIYPLFAAPFAKLGGLGGMFVFNVLLLAGCVWLGVTFGAARTRSAAGGIIGAGFVIASVLPVWTAWLTPEIFNVALVLSAYFLWLYKEVSPLAGGREWWRRPAADYAAAALIGMATFSKPNHALMIAPLGLLALSRWQIKRAVLMGVWFSATVGALYGVNLIATGELNYQGSVYADGRITCYDTFPFDGKGTTFAVTKQCQSKVTNEANDEHIVQYKIFPTHAMLGTFVRNSYYFFVGRDAGLLPFFFPGLFIAVLFLMRFWESKPWQWLTLLIVGGQIWTMLALIPWTWNGDGGPPGNRYFISTYPLLLFLMPSSLRWGSALFSLLGGFLFTGSMTLTPLRSAKETWWAVERQPLKSLPVELTIPNALPVRLLDNDRARIKWNEHRADGAAYVQFYFLDRNVYGVDRNGDSLGLWTRGGATGDMIVKAEFPLTTITFAVTSPIDNEFTAEMGADHHSVVLKKDVPQTFELAAGSPVWSDGSFVYELKLSTAKGFVATGDPRYLGAFVTPTFRDTGGK